MPRQLISILTVAGSDCSGGAGIQADIRAAALCNVYASTTVTAVTVQNSQGLTEICVMSPEIVEKQIRSVFDDAYPKAIKIGMLGSLENGKAIVRILQDYAGEEIPIIIDPVMKATAGGNFSKDDSALESFYAYELFPLATVVTPNLEEIRKFVPCNGSYKDMAVYFLKQYGCKAVILKGGHSEQNLITDLLAITNHDQGYVFQEVTASRIECKNLHGTGCVYSSILTAEIAKGKSITEAFLLTSWSMKSIIADSSDYIIGKSDYGPLNLFSYQTL